MRRLTYTLVVTLVLVISGFVIVGFIGSKSQLPMKQETAMPTILPPALAGFPDIEYVPIYPNAAVTFTKNESLVRRIAYEVTDGMDDATEFYREMLPKKGWHFQSTFAQRDLYSWTEPAEKPLWNMYLIVNFELTLDNTKTVVYLEYGRSPVTEGGLPLYPDAQQTATTRSTVEKDLSGEKVPVLITDLTYLSSSSLPEIATFYSNIMNDYGWRKQEPGWSVEKYGWFPFDDPGSWPGDKQSSDTNTEEGLYFVAVRPSWEMGTDVVSYHLLATATVQEDGQAVIKLHVEEFVASLGKF